MPTFNIAASTTSRPHVAPVGSIVKVTPSAGASVNVEYTTGSAASVANGVATWTAWPKGQVSAQTSDLVSNPSYVRITALAGSVMLDIDPTPSAAALAAFRSDWGGTGSGSSAGAAATISGTPSVGSVLTAKLPTGVTGTLQWTRTMLNTPFTKSNISGAVANAVNSLAYTVQQADAGYSVGCDASSTIVASTGVSIAAVATVRSNGISRLFGTQSQVAEPSPLTASTSGWVYKVQAPAGATGVRISVHNKSQLFGVAGIKAAVAPTDIAAIDTTANAFNAQVNSTVNNIFTTGGNANGFKKATWNGAAQSRRIYPSNATLPSFGYNDQEDTVTSDLIQLPSTPIPARDRGSPEYYYIVRLSILATAQVDGLAGVTASKMNSYMAEWTATSGADCHLLIGNSPGNVDSADGSFTIPGAATNGQAPVVSFEWTYPAGITPVTFWHDGDSITEDYQWNRWAVNRKSTPTRPLHHVNIGGSTTRTKDYLGNLYLLLQAMAKPDYVVMPIISVNNYSPLSDFTNNFSNAQIEYNRLVEVAQYLTALGIKIIWWVPFNYGANPLSSDTASSWGYLYNSAKTYAASNGITWMDINGDSRMVRSVYNATTNPTGWIDPDNTHPSTPAGKAGFAQVYTETLAALGF